MAIKLESQFEGWTKKIEHASRDSNGGYCATGWLSYRRGEWLQSSATVQRVGCWVLKNLNPPATYVHKAGHTLYPQDKMEHAVVWANNECLLDIEGFKRVDLCMQLEEKRKELEGCEK